jgi:peptidoglycan/LPS O-acetylase OafA/YrhL
VVYVVLAAPLFHYLKACPDNRLQRLLRVLPAHTWLPALAGVLVTVFLEPHITPELFSAHFFLFWYGLACFVFGILLVSIGEGFWQGIRRVCHVALAGALALYLLRMSGFDLGAGLGGAPGRLTALALESACGMIAFLGYGSLLFSRRSRGFAVLNRSVFAIYILHFPVQQAIGCY